MSRIANPDSDKEALKQYNDALARRKAIKDLWKQEGCPLLSVGSHDQVIEHPLVKMLREHDILVQKLSVNVKKQHVGPQPSAVIKPSPAAKLRKVENA